MLSNADTTTDIIEIPHGVPKPVDVLAIADPPVHTRQRKLLNPQFNGSPLQSYEAPIKALSLELLQSALVKPKIEWMQEYAVPLPLLSIARILGFPLNDYEKLLNWSEAGVCLVNGTASGQDLPTMAAAVIEFQAYLSEQLRRGSTGLTKKLRSLVETESSLEFDEAVSILLQLVIAGSESTSSLLGSIAHTVSTQPQLRTQLLETPAQRNTFIDELIRLEPPFKGHFRVVKEPTTIGSQKLLPGDRLMLDWEAANRDPAVFTCPSEMNHQRSNLRSHLGFGYGIHRCIGANLAKLEARIALEDYLHHLPTAKTPKDYKADFVPSIFTRRLIQLPLEVQ